MLSLRLLILSLVALLAGAVVTAAANDDTCTVMPHCGYDKGTREVATASSQAECCALCSARPGCAAGGFTGTQCWFKTAKDIQHGCHQNPKMNSSLVKNIKPAPPPPLPPPAGLLYDSFTTYNDSLWAYSDMEMGTTDGCKVWYLKNHSTVGANLSLSEGPGLRMLMSSTPCRQDPEASCGGAKMASDHVGSTSSFGFGDYELRMRAPHVAQADTCSHGIYAYFTAGFVKGNGEWDEINFGFDPDRDNNGTTVSCQHHDDKGGYHMTSVELGFNYRASFNTYVIQLRKDSITWLVGHGKQPGIELKTVHQVKTTLSQALLMTTRLIMRTNFKNGDPGYMPDTVWELSHFKFTPE